MVGSPGNHIRAGYEAGMPHKLHRSLGKRALEVFGGGLDSRDLLRLAARTYLKGEGLEIGALHEPEKVPRGARVRYVDWKPLEELRRSYPELRDRELVEVHIVDDGSRLGSVADASQDFVIAAHVIEHLEDPIGALVNYLRVLKYGGVIFLAIPDKRHTFDKDRPVTRAEHLLRDFHEGPDWSRRAHYEEWARLIQGAADEEQARAMAVELQARRESIHFHVFTQAAMIEMLTAVDRLRPFDIAMMYAAGNECVFVLRKTGPATPTGGAPTGAGTP